MRLASGLVAATLAGLALVAATGCGGPSGPRAWEQAPSPTPEETIASAVLTELAIAGAGETCFAATDELPTGGVVVRMTRGAGFAAVQRYVR